jgi:hypothetical protein
LAISGDYAWLAKEAAGLSIIDISCPTDLRHVVGSHRTNGRTLGLAVLGNYSYLADDRGLSIIEFNEVPAITHVERTGNTVTLRWNDSARGMRLQRTANASSPAWVDLMDTENTNRITLPLNGESEFFQLTHP